MSSIEVEKKNKKREAIKVAKGIYRDKLNMIERKKELKLEEEKEEQ